MDPASAWWLPLAAAILGIVCVYGLTRGWHRSARAWEDAFDARLAEIIDGGGFTGFRLCARESFIAGGQVHLSLEVRTNLPELPLPLYEVVLRRLIDANSCTLSSLPPACYALFVIDVDATPPTRRPAISTVGRRSPGPCTSAT